MLGKNFGKKLCILTIDLEEWFHILDVEPLTEHERWDHFETRIYKNTYRLLDFLKNRNLKATFFVLGWVAQKYPDLVSSIFQQGHEIGTHSLNHILIYKSSPESFRRDIRQSIDVIQDITNRKVRAFRAPGFSIKKETFWAFDILSQEGIEVDSSIFPASRGHGGIRDFTIDFPFRIKVRDTIIKEFPINIFSIGRLKIPFTGGGYFRIIPPFLSFYFADRCDYIMIYFHPRDFDPDQPIIPEIPLNRKFKSYYGIKGAFKKFEKFIDRYDFINIAMAEELITWDDVPLINLS